MFQYFPAYRAVGHPLFGRRLWREECQPVARAAEEKEWLRGWKQDYG
jgi:uncharacterized Fe-S radical SAM superfamily protein PflX